MGTNIVNLSRESVQALRGELVATSKLRAPEKQEQIDQLGQLAVNAVWQLGQEVEALRRQQEIIADIGWTVGYNWQPIDEKLRGQIMDAVEGSRGLMEKCTDWAKEFDAIWEAKDKDKREDYISEVDEFATEKFRGLVAEVRLDN